MVFLICDVKLKMTQLFCYKVIIPTMFLHIFLFISYQIVFILDVIL